MTSEFKLAVSGAAGRMGQRIIAFSNESKIVSLAAAFDIATHPRIGDDVGLLAGIGEKGVLLSDSMVAAKGCNVLIDFSSAEATESHIKFCAENGINLVVGTTGLSDKVKADIKKASEKVAVVFAPNMGVGINVLLSIVNKMAAVLGDEYDVEIIEAHHNKKKDAPSGTAIGLAEAVASGMQVSLAEKAIHGRSGLVGARPKKEIGIHAVRGGDIIGEHTVMFAGPGETIEVSHSVLTRDVFAKGAVRAAEFLAGKKSGLFNMQDVLGLK
ncbi:MAG: 4-hydroxy-tetrahydrodipicolinate reductase [Fibrobacteres bacterium]|nr:4-hydroxy-tetrahydrodipicolinate reductase [Fibrobacterota bacterium]